MENLEIYLDYIGDDSYVYRYNYDNKKYYNTGICLKGNPGNPGRPGKNGDSWSLKDIDGTYYWFKNGVNTGIPAQTNTNISGKEDVTTIVAPVNETDATLPITTLTTEIGKYYRIDVPIETLGITLPAMDTVTSVKKVDIYFTAGTTPAITIAAADNKSVAFQDGYEIETGKTYEINCLYNGAAWVVSALTIIKPFFAKLTLNNGEVVELEGNGELTRAMVSDQYKDTLVSAEIGELCTSIGSSAFFYCRGLTSVTIPDSVESIGGGVFTSCSGLTSVTIGSSVKSIGDSAFHDCSSLTSIVVDSANTVYDSRDNCNAIINKSTNELIKGCKNTIIPNSVTSIGSSAFGTCSSLTSIDIPNSVTSIGQTAFAACSGLTSVTIPDSVKSIGYRAFFYCRGLTSVTIGSSVKSIGDEAFTGCSGLTNITSLAMTVPAIQRCTFQDVKKYGTLTVPSGSSGYDIWMSDYYYLGKYNWTKVEQ